MISDVEPTAPAWWGWWCCWWWGRLLRLQPIERIELALECLSLCETPPGKIPYRDLIPGIARHLTLMKRNDGRPGPSMAAQLKPVVLHLRALALSEQWDGLADPPPSYSLPVRLRLRLIALAAEAGEIAQEIAPHISRASRRPASRPKHTTAPRDLAVYLYQEFERLTGRTPGRSVVGGDERGEFTALVREVFKILGIRASPELATRYAIRVHGNITKKTET